MMCAAQLRMPIGESDFRLLIEEGYYFVDKSLFIQEVLDDARVIFITRPRRFGKTLNLSMLRYYFAKTVDGYSTAHLFHDLAIESADERIRHHQGRYPVIFLTFKDLKFNTFEETHENFCQLITLLYEEYRYLLCEAILTPTEKKRYKVCFLG